MRMLLRLKLPLRHSKFRRFCIVVCLICAGIIFLPVLACAQEKTAPDFGLTLKEAEAARKNGSTTVDFMRLRNRPDDSLLITSLYLGGILLQDDFLVYEDADQGKFFVPLDDVLRALKFPIKIDAQSGTATGWFLRESNTFSLDLKAGSVTIDGKTRSLVPGGVEMHDDGIYVTLEALARWFPLTAQMDYNNLAVIIKSLEPFPVEVEMARSKKHDQLAGKKKHEDELNPLENVPVSLFSVPHIDNTAQMSYDNSQDAQRSLQTSYTSLISGTVLGQDTNLSINDTIADASKPDLRVIMGREDPGGDLLGLGLSEYKFGDVSMRPISFLTRSNSGRGFTLSSKAQDYSSSVQSNTVELRGDLPVGYQLDIVKDGQLIGFVEEPDENGEYVFEADVLPGLNVFELVFYGPQGQKDTKEERVYVPSNPVKKGAFDYSLSAVQDSSRVFLNKTNSSDADRGAGRVSAQAEYGLSDESSLFGALASVSVEGQRRNYGLMRYSRSFKGIRADLSYALSDRKGKAFGVALQSVFKGIRWQMEHKQLYHFESEETLQAGLSGDLRYDTSFNMSGLVPFFSNVPFSFKLNRLENTDGIKRTDLQTRVTKNIGKLRFTTQFDQSLRSDQDTTADAGLQVSSRFENVTIRGSMQYSMQPDSYLKNINLSADWHYRPDTVLQAGLRHVGGGSRLNTLTLGASHDFKPMNVGITINYNDQDELLAILGTSFSLGYDPVKSLPYAQRKSFGDSALFVPRVFFDKNSNSVFDGDDYWIDKAGFLGRGIDKKARTNADGYALVSASSYQRSSITVDPSSLSDPYMRVKAPPKDYILRPGQTVITDFPVIMTGEIDSQLYAFSRGKLSDAQSIKVNVFSEDGKVVASGRSEYDGFVFINDIPVGQYDVQPDSAQMAELGYCAADKAPLVLSADEPSISLDAFYLWPKGHPDKVSVILGRALSKEEGVSLWKRLRGKLGTLFVEKRDVPSAYLLGAQGEGDYDLTLYDVQAHTAAMICSSLHEDGAFCEVKKEQLACPARVAVIDQIDPNEGGAGQGVSADEPLDEKSLKDLGVEDVEQLIDN